MTNDIMNPQTIEEFKNILLTEDSAIIDDNIFSLIKKYEERPLIYDDLMEKKTR